MSPCLELFRDNFVQHDPSFFQDLRTHEERRWYALFTIPQNEKAVAKHLGYFGMDSFLPTYEVPRLWRNRQRKLTVFPLFPNYVFVHMNRHDRNHVLQIPGAIQLVGRPRDPVPLPDAEIEFLRSDFCRKRLEPYPELAVGSRVRVRRGIMQGVEGVLVRKANSLRFVLMLSAISLQAAVEVCADDLEVLCA